MKCSIDILHNHVTEVFVLLEDSCYQSKLLLSIEASSQSRYFDVKYKLKVVV